MGPYKRGYLTGKYLSVNELPLEEDAYWRYNLNLNPYKVADTIDRVKILTQQYGSPYQLRQESINHILSNEGASSCVIGHMSSHDIFENIAPAKAFHCKKQVKDINNTEIATLEESSQL